MDSNIFLKSNIPHSSLSPPLDELMPGILEQTIVPLIVLPYPLINFKQISFILIALSSKGFGH